LGLPVDIEIGFKGILNKKISVETIFIKQGFYLTSIKILNSHLMAIIL
jgi:hypothetical protein